MRPHAPGRLAGTAAGALLLLLGTWPIGAENRDGQPANDVRTVTHVLNRLGFGPRPGDVARVAQIGVSAYIDQQLHPERIDDSAAESRIAGLRTLSLSSADLARDYFVPAQQLRRAQQLQAGRGGAAAQPKPGGDAEGDTMSPDAAAAPPAAPAVTPEMRQAQMAAQNVLQELMQAKMLRATLSERQLDEVLADFWFNHFNVFVGKGQVRLYLTEYERDAIRPHVLGKFRDLLGAVAHSPAMLFYLDNWQSAAPNAQLIPPAVQARLNDPRLRPQQRAQLQARLNQLEQRQPRGLNENYAREIMEL